MHIAWQCTLSVDRVTSGVKRDKLDKEGCQTRSVRRCSLRENTCWNVYETSKSNDPGAPEKKLVKLNNIPLRPASVVLMC